MVLAASEDKRRARRLDRRAEHAVGVGHADARGAASSPARTTSSGRATSTTWPPRRRRPATTRRRRACSTTCGASRSRTARGGRTRAWTAREYWTEPAARRGRAAGRARLVARPARRGRLGARPARRPTSSSPTGRRPSRSAGRTRTAGRRTRSPPRSPALICAADVARANGDAARAARYEATADEWQAQVEAWTATTNGPYSDEPYYLRVTKDAQPGRRQHVQPRRQLPAARSTSARSSTTRSSGWCCSAPSRGTTRPCATRSPSATRSSRRTRRAAGSGTASRSTATARRPTGGDWDIFPTAERQTFGRVWPLLAGERGEYELLAGGDARPHLRTIANTANDGLMLPEQAWDGRRARVRARRRGHALGDAAGLDARAVRAPRVVDRRGRADRAAVDRRLPLTLGDGAADRPLN